MELTQHEADRLLAMPKRRGDETVHRWLDFGGALAIPLRSHCGHEDFVLDLGRGSIRLAKTKVQNRSRRVFVLARLDIAGPAHVNPDGVEIGGNHLHLYREGYGDKWAYPIPVDKFSNPADIWLTFCEFNSFCSITEPPLFEPGTFKW